MRIEFIVKCCTIYGVCDVGDVVEASDGTAQMLISAGYAKPYVAVPKAEVVTKKANKRKGGAK